MILLRWTLLSALLAGMPLRAIEQVEVAVKPPGPWKKYPTRTLEDLPSVLAAAPDGGLNLYGGRKEPAQKATGFFRAEKIGPRWWLVDPAGGRFLNRSVVSVTMMRTAGAEAALAQRFGDEAGWAAQTTAWLRELGFNGVGAWSDAPRLRAAPTKLTYTLMWNFMSSYGKKRGGTFQQSGHTGYPGDCIFVFDPEFAAFCDEHARQLAATKDDPWLLGHFTDNELPLQRKALENYLALAATDPGHQAAWKFLRERHGAAATTREITDADREAFLELVTDRYLSIVSAAIRRHDPNHMVLGPRLHGEAVKRPEVFRASGRHLDVVAVNYYHAWSADPELTAMWVREAGRPFLVTEWYAKGMDAPGMANVSGAGWVVRTQRDRGRYYENFTLSLMENRGCVGWHWFKYIDNDPADKKADPSNRDSNKGIVSNRYEPYGDLIAAMRRLNERAYQVIDHFDAAAR